jgi:non-homologous end joining protein Ku
MKRTRAASLRSDRAACARRMAEAGVAGIGRLTLNWRERVVMVEPRVTGMALFTLRAADEVRVSQFDSTEGDLNAELVSIAKRS